MPGTQWLLISKSCCHYCYHPFSTLLFHGIHTPSLHNCHQMVSCPFLLEVRLSVHPQVDHLPAPAPAMISSDYSARKSQHGHPAVSSLCLVSSWFGSSLTFTRPSLTPGGWTSLAPLHLEHSTPSQGLSLQPNFHWAPEDFPGKTCPALRRKTVSSESGNWHKPTDGKVE